MIYLDNAATSFPKPEIVYSEVMNCMRNYCANSGRGVYEMSLKASSKIAEAREEVCKLFNIANSLNLIFTSNATEALNIGIKGVLKRKDHVITTAIEHNSVLRPLYSLGKDDIDVTIVGCDKMGFINIDDIEREINSSTKMIIINHVSNVLGTIQNIEDIGKIARNNGILFMVDASQSAGSIPIDVEKNNIDLLAFSGHKGLLGPQGTGGLYIREGIKISNYTEGGTGSNSHYMTQPDFLPDKFESGTLNTPGIAGLCEGVKFIRQIGINKINNYERKLTTYFLDELKNYDYVKVYGNRDSNGRTSVVSFNIDSIDASIVGEKLNDAGIAVRTGYHCTPLIHNIIRTNNLGTVRASFGYFNTIEDVEKLIKGIIRIKKYGYIGVEL